MWEFEHSVETEAGREFVWAFWTDVANWAFDSSIEWVRLEGPFATGTRGATKSPGLEPVHWTLKDVKAGSEATIEMQLAEATMRCHWRFEATANGGTRLTQRMTYTGPDVESFVQHAAPQFEKGVPEGMRRLVAELELAEQRGPHN